MWIQGSFLFKKKDTMVEFFGLHGNSDSSSLQSLYLSYPQLLKSFTSHFKKEHNPILNQMKQEGVSLIDLQEDNFFFNQSICHEISPAVLKAFYKDLGMKGELEKAEKLSLRELQCLKLLIEEKSAKETAAIFGLSRRTIEYYFENIKDKLSCWSKKEVLAHARTFKDIGLL